jgi:nucleoid DNA-binding protein
MKNKFIKADLQAIIVREGTDTEAARRITARIVSGMAAALAAGRTIELRGMGTLEPRERKAALRHDPRNMEPVHVPARRIVVFRPGQELRAALRKAPE